MGCGTFSGMRANAIALAPGSVAVSRWCREKLRPWPSNNEGQGLGEYFLNRENQSHEIQPMTAETNIVLMVMDATLLTGPWM